MRKYLFTALIALLSAVAAIAGYKMLESNEPNTQNPTPVTFTSSPYSAPPVINMDGQPADFTAAAAVSTPAVVHVRTSYSKERSSSEQDPWEDLFGDDWDMFKDYYGPSQASGSGVIMSSDGYIITNNHVVDGASEIEITLWNNKSYKAELIGIDKDTDIALVKINTSIELPFVRFADSDSVRIGEWVLAVGNPFNLASTVTAGIVSAKGRNINILQNRNGNGGNTAIESFIQTDAAVNPGNSGGALVNIRGELIGINTAIATPTGTFAGYSFAVPINLVEKVVTDLRDFGVVQRGFLGVNITSMDQEIAEDLDISYVEGVYLNGILNNSAADEAGLKVKDVVISINGVSVKSAPELQEQVAKYRPGDAIEVEFIRNGNIQKAMVTLKNKYNETGMIDNSKDVLESLGVELTNLNERDLEKYGLREGVKITELSQGKLKTYTDVREGFIITHVDGQEVASKQDFINVMKNKSGNVKIEGIYPEDQYKYLYAFNW